MLRTIFEKIKHLSKKQMAIAAIILIVLGFFIWTKVSSAQQSPQYQTATVEKGTLVTTVSASGTISSGSNATITTGASGVVTDVYVKPGDSVTQGEKIADISLDQNAQQKQASAWASYLQAKNAVDSANTNLYTLQSAEFVANQKFINDAVARNLPTDDPTYIEENAQWLAAEAAYKNQQNVIAQAQANLTSAWLSYQQISPEITSPATGTVNSLSLSVGLPLMGGTSQNSNNNSANSNTNSSQTVGTISLANSQIQATVNLSEIDVTKVQAGQKVTLTLDAFPDKTFTGKVLSIDTTGSVSSGVTTYPAIIALDSAANTIYPNMAVSAKIITAITDNVLLVPSTALQSQGGSTTIRLLKNGQLQSVDVTPGDANDTETVITSGVSEGDTVVTSILNTTRSSGATSSPFSGTGIGGFRAGGGFGGGNAVFRRGQ